MGEAVTTRELSAANAERSITDNEIAVLDFWAARANLSSPDRQASPRQPY